MTVLAPLAFLAVLAAGALLGFKRPRPVPRDLLRADGAQQEDRLDQSEVTQEVEATAFSHGPHVP